MTESITTLTTQIVANYVAANKVGAGDISTLIQTVYTALDTVGQKPEAPVTETNVTPVQIRKSITPDALISFEDGRPYKTLKRHLHTRGLTAKEYKAKWGLPQDYPTTAPNYSAARAALARSSGLGRKAPPPAPASAATAPAAKAGAKTKTAPKDKSAPAAKPGTKAKAKAKV